LNLEIPDKGERESESGRKRWNTHFTDSLLFLDSRRVVREEDEEEDSPI